MTWTEPFIAVTGAVIASAAHNAGVRGNLLHLRSMLPDAVTAGLALVATGSGTAAWGQLAAAGLANNAVETAKILEGAVTADRLDTNNDPAEGRALVWSSSDSKMSWASPSGVPAGAVVWFETLAELTAAGSGWARYTAGDARLLIGDGTFGGQSFTAANNYGSSWSHKHTGISWANMTTGQEDQVQSSPYERIQRGSESGEPNFHHTHKITVGGDTTDATWLPPMRSGVWGRKN